MYEKDAPHPVHPSHLSYLFFSLLPFKYEIYTICFSIT